MIKKKKAWLGTAAATVMISSIATGCGQSSSNTPQNSSKSSPPSSSSTSTPGHKTLKIGTYTTFETLDPVTSHTLVDLQVMDNIYGTLLKASPSGKLGPGILEKWEIKDGGLVYVLHLRHGVKFQDGTPFNAQAVKDDWERILNPASDSVQLSNLGPVKSIQVNSAHTLTVTFKQPFAPFLDNLTAAIGMIPSPTAVKKEGKDFGTHPVGAGPFEMKSWVPGGAITLIKNPDYWHTGFPLLNKVVFDPIISASTMVTALDSGQIQIADVLDPSQVSQVQSSDATVSQVPGLGWFALNLNETSGPLANVHARRAIQYAIDRKAIKKVVYDGTGALANSQFSPSSWAYDPNIPIVYSLKKARRELKEAGLPNGFSFTLQAQNTEKYILLTQVIQAQLAKVGIHVKVDLLDTSTYLTNLNSGGYQADFINMSGSLDPNAVSYIFDESSADVVKNGFDNPTVNSLMNKALVTSNENVRKKYYREAAVLMNQDVPMVNLINPAIIVGLSKEVHGFVNYPTQYMFLSHVTLG